MSAPTQPMDEPDLDELLAPTQANPSLESLNTLEDTSYFDNTTVVANTPIADEDVNDPDGAHGAKKMDSNDLDFDMEGLSLDSMEVPNTIPHPMPAEEKPNLDEINFDFLDEKSDQASTLETKRVPVAAAEELAIEIPMPKASDLDMPAVNPSKEMASAETESDDLAVMLNDLPDLPDTASATVAVSKKPEASAMDFDLSSITLELDPGSGSSTLVQDGYATHDTGGSDDFSNNAEMATKLDLAVAYQEIGDKEGACELLDEVVKGGTSEQSERAHALLAKLT